MRLSGVLISILGALTVVSSLPVVAEGGVFVRDAVLRRATAAWRRDEETQDTPPWIRNAGTPPWRREAEAEAEADANSAVWRREAA